MSLPPVADAAGLILSLPVVYPASWRGIFLWSIYCGIFRGVLERSATTYPVILSPEGEEFP
jgi:hypothetical protein